MIEINLAPGNSKNIDDVGGFNLSLLNVKMLVIAIVALYGGEILVGGYFDGELEVLTKKQTDFSTEQREVSTRLRTLDNVKKQVEDLNKQEVILAKRIDVVKQIVSQRQNPFKILKYVAENTPKDIWLNEIELVDRKLKLSGNSKSWKSIGEFLQNLKTSIFLEANVSYKKPENVDNTFKGQRIEPFEIEATVVRFQ